MPQLGAERGCVPQVLIFRVPFAPFPMTITRPSLLDLHPVEALLALLLISVAALHRLFRGQVGADWKRQPLVRVTWLEPPFSVSYGALTTEGRTACAAAARSVAEQVLQLQRLRFQPVEAKALLALTVAELRTMARHRGILSAGGRPIHKARRADLLYALGL